MSPIPILSYYARVRGWPFIISWCQRLSGIILVLFLLIHINSLHCLSAPDTFQGRIQLFNSLPLVVLEWALAIPVIFHAMNGGRIILYECYGIRNDKLVMSWVMALCSIYVLLKILLDLIGNQEVSPVLFYLISLSGSLVLCYAVSMTIYKTGHSIFWQLQRITAAFMIIMIPCHLMFMHLNPQVGKDINIILARMQNPFIKLVNIILIFTTAYHASYGLISVLRDYISSHVLMALIISIVVLAMAIGVFYGTKIVLLV